MSRGGQPDNSSTSFLGMLTILFIGLKLTGFIDWSWFWVLSPIVIPLLLTLFIVGLLLLASK